MEPLSLEDIARASGGSLLNADSGITVHSVSTDTRSVTAGALFIALKGERFDGHTFAATAFENGAAAVMADWNGATGITGPCVAVNDTLQGLQRLAAWYRQQLPVKIAGITGSNGKTTTKEMLAAILTVEFNVHKTAGNLNNHIGVPLTLLGLDRSHGAAVVEMGMSASGEIDLLCRLATPDTGVITGIAPAHLESMKSIENIAAAKLELARALPAAGTVIINGDEPLLTAALPSIDAATITFGYADGNALCISGVERNDAGGYSFVLNGETAVELRIPGRHNVMNAVAAMGAAREFGITLGRSAAALSGFSMGGMRLEPVVRGGIAFLNDAYNANPASVAAALDELAAAECTGRRIAVLGDMLELGEKSSDFHYEIGRKAAEYGIDYLLAAGVEGSFYAGGALKGGMDSSHAVYCSSVGQLSERLAALAEPGDLVLVKGSRGMRMEDVLTYMETQQA